MAEGSGRPLAPGGLALVQAFVNTLDVDRGTDELADLDGARTWLRRHGLAGGEVDVDAAARSSLVEVREALRSLLLVNAGSPADPAAAAVLDAAAHRAGLRPRFGADGSVRLEAAVGGVDGALGRVLAGAEAAMRDGTWVRLKVCAEDTCRWAFYDGSKNRSGRWCTMRLCGNRDKSRRAYRRRREADSHP